MINQEEIEAYWQEFIKTYNLDSSIRYRFVDHFEVTEYWCNYLLDLVLINQKKATSSSYDAYIIENEELPKVGDYSIITNWDGTPKCIVKTTNVLIKKFKDFTFDIIKEEGEDDNLTTWKESHQRFFQIDAKELGYTFTEDSLIVFESFVKEYPKE